MNKNDYNIRLEEKNEYRAVENLTREAFWNVYRPGCTEHYVLHCFRDNKDFVPELDFVMEKDNQLIGHVMFVRATIETEDGRTIPIMTFGPISILPEYQRKGYGKALLDYSLEKAKEMGVGAVCMEGNIDFYGKSGFVVASTKGIHYRAEPKEAEVPYFLLKELREGFLDGITGTYYTPQAYYVDDEAAEKFDQEFPQKEKLKKDCKDVVFYNKRSKDNELFRLYATHDFEMVIYFSKTLESFETNYEELEELEKSLKICVEHKISNFIYITGFGPSVNDNKMAKGQYTILKHACEQLCESFAEGNGISVTVIKTPMVYSETLGTNTISHWIREASSTQPIACALAPNTMVDFLCDKDLGELLKRIVDAPRKERYTVIPLSGNNEMTVQEVQDRIVQEFPGTVVEYTSSYTEMEQGDNNKTVVRLYGWKPSHGIHEEFSLMMREWKAQPKVEEKKKPSKIFHEIRMYAELILGFVCVVVLNSWTETNILLSFLDFRMLYVIVAGITYGLGAGVAAAVLCCGNYVAQNALSTHWQILFYNVQNWLPFACYILLGTVTGYIKNKYENEMAFLKKEQEILENKYVFLNQQYIKAVENKNLFNNQIIAYQDSYGKLYSAVKKLDCTLTSEVFFEAINVLEEILGNQSVAIYSVNGTSDYARLKVCSKSIHHELSKSLVLSEYKEMVDELQKNQTFVNTACLPAYPAYAAPIYNENSLVGMILILHADDRQMNMEFFNKFTIFASLIKDSLIRAMEYENFSNQVIEGTQIMKPETFEEILKISEQMRQKEYLEYTLIQIEHAEMDSKQLGNLVDSMVRASDILGMTTNGKLQLLLNQTGKEDFSIIGERMKKHNIKFDVIKV